MAGLFRRSVAVASEALALEKKQPAKLRRTNPEFEFLPAALEVIESPPSPVGRWITASLMLLLVLAIAWGIFGRVDIVAIAPGKIIPSSHTKIIQPLEIGVIRALYVTDGQKVTAGQLLIQLDPTSTTADADRLSSDLLATQTESARLRATGSKVAFNAPSNAPAELVATNRALLESQKREHEARLAALASEIKRKRSEQRVARAAITKLEKLLVFSRERLQIRREYYEKGFFPRLQLLEVEELVISQEQELQGQKHHEQESIDAMESLQKQRAQAEAEYQKSALNQLVDSERRTVGLKQELIKAERREQSQRLTAPIDGVVQQLAVHTVGGVVSPAQALMVIVPENDVLEVEGRLLNLDVGFVEIGQRVEVKLDAFQFTKYGTVPGVIQGISADSVEDEKLGLVFPIRVKLDRNKIRVNDRWVNLSPGMSATVEIKTGSRRLIEYLLSPVLRYNQESMRER